MNKYLKSDIFIIYIKSKLFWYFCYLINNMILFKFKSYAL